jgi:hypothetical protein
MLTKRKAKKASKFFCAGIVLFYLTKISLWKSLLAF